MDPKARNLFITKLFFMWVALLGLSHTTWADKTKPALKALEKGEFDKVEELVVKSLEKDSINPGSKYVFSLLYATSSFPRYNVDSAHFFVSAAQKEFDLVSEKDQEGLIKDDVTRVLIESHHSHVDSLAFAVAVSKNSLGAYNYYIERYEDSALLNEAVKRRNTVAFNLAAQTGTWQSYKGFLDTYPQAAEAGKAKKEYDRLIFEEKTHSGGLEEMEGFLDSQPETPYREILEEKIFGFMAGFGEPHKILNFLANYDNGLLGKKALNLLHHIEPDNKDYLKILNSSPWKSHLDSLNELKEVNQPVLVPFLADGKYGFGDLNGDIVIDLQFDQIEEEHYCGNISGDVLSITLDKTNLLVNRKLDTIYQGRFDRHVDLGNGILKVVNKGKAGALHKSGFRILPFIYEDVSMLNNSLLKTKRAGKYGISGFLGKELVAPKYDNIYLSHGFIVIEDKGRISINLASSFVDNLKNDKFNPVFKYEDFEIIGSNVICFDGDDEMLLDSLLNEVVPMGPHRINTKFETWVVKQANGYRLFDRQTEKLQSEVYANVIQNEQWMAVKNQKWSLYSKSISDVPIVGLDSVNLLGEDIALMFRGESGTAIFPNKKIVEFSKDEKLRSISSGKNTNVHFLVISRGGKNILYRDGERVIESVYEIGYIADNVFSAKARGEYGAMDTRAQLIMRVRYDAIGEAENGISPVLYNGRFGAYNFNERILISLKFDEKLKPYNDELLITKSRDKIGLYSVKNENVVDNEYDEILYWSDSVALVKKDREWSLYGIYDDKPVFSGITDFDFISRNESEIVIKYRTATGMGVYSTLHGSLFEPTFNDIINIGTEETPFYFCEKSIREADYYVAVYKNARGETVRTQAYRGSEYEKIVCEN